VTAVRIQRKRIAGWRMPGNTVYVGRPSKWGNPFYLKPRGSKVEVFSRIDLTEDGEDALVAIGDSHRDAARKAVKLFKDALLEGDLEYWSSDVQNELRDYNLACWCPIGSPCHADVLLAIANSECERTS
jgi:hypothetical protein